MKCRVKSVYVKNSRRIVANCKDSHLGIATEWHMKKRCHTSQSLTHLIDLPLHNPHSLEACRVSPP